MIKLTIGICSVPQRINHLARLLATLEPQLTEEVELIIITDNQRRSLGQKRQDISLMAKGTMLSFIDDDDRIEPGYVHTLLSAPPAHIIAFNTMVRYGVEYNPEPVLCDFDINHEHEVNEPNFLRWPNQLCAINTRVVRAVGWRDVFKEDFDFAIRLKSYYFAHGLKQVKLDRVLYHYDYSFENTMFK